MNDSYKSSLRHQPRGQKWLNPTCIRAMIQCRVLMLLTGLASLAATFAADTQPQQAVLLVSRDPRAPKLAESFEVQSSPNCCI